MGLNVNTLVKHRTKNLGIGCVSKVLMSTYKVNFGLSSTQTCRPNDLEEVDTSKCKTITFEEFRTTIMSAATGHPYVILGNELKHYVGIGWVTHRVVTIEDLKKYPRVV